MTITVVGGTFSILHKGHRLLLGEACRESERVIIGLATDDFSASRKSYSPVPFETRKKNLESFFLNIGCTAEIRPLTRSEGTADTDPSFDRIVVSEETEEAARSINEKRKKNGLSPLVIDTVPVVLADDLFPVGSSRILGKEIDGEGKRLKPLAVSVASGNGQKLQAVKEYFESLGVATEVHSNMDYETNNQPFGEDITAMAYERAKSSRTGYDYSLGIEAGLVLDRASNKYFDVHVCVVLDRYRNLTTGMSSAFQVPGYLIDRVKTGIDVSLAYEKEHNVADIGKNEGIIGIFSGGKVTRHDLIEESIRNAFIPRHSPYSYGLSYSEKFQ